MSKQLVVDRTYESGKLYLLSYGEYSSHKAPVLVRWIKTTDTQTLLNGFFAQYITIPRASDVDRFLSWLLVRGYAKEVSYTEINYGADSRLSLE